MKLIFTASYDVYKHFYSSLGARKYSAELTYAQFLSNNSLTWCWIDRHMKSTENFWNRSKGPPLRGDTVYRKLEIFDSLGQHSHPLRRLKLNFLTAKHPQVPSAMPSLTWIGATTRPCGAKKPTFWPVRKCNTGSLLLGGIQPVKTATCTIDQCPAAVCLWQLHCYRCHLFIHFFIHPSIRVRQ